MFLNMRIFLKGWAVFPCEPGREARRARVCVNCRSGQPDRRKIAETLPGRSNSRAAGCGRLHGFCDAQAAACSNNRFALPSRSSRAS